MLRVLTEEESRAHNEKKLIEVDEWWSDLSLREKSLIFDYHKDLFKQVKCNHVFYSLPFYSGTIESCRKCGLDRKVEDVRNDILNEILKNNENMNE